jgi:hypothetical protein
LNESPLCVNKLGTNQKLLGVSKITYSGLWNCEVRLTVLMFILLLYQTSPTAVSFSLRNQTLNSEHSHILSLDIISVPLLTTDES